MRPPLGVQIDLNHPGSCSQLVHPSFGCTSASTPPRRIVGHYHIHMLHFFSACTCELYVCNLCCILACFIRHGYIVKPWRSVLRAIIERPLVCVRWSVTTCVFPLARVAEAGANQTSALPIQRLPATGAVLSAKRSTPSRKRLLAKLAQTQTSARARACVHASYVFTHATATNDTGTYPSQTDNTN